MLHKNRVFIYINQIEEDGTQLIHQLDPKLLDLSESDHFHSAGEIGIDLWAKLVGTSVLVEGKITTSVTSECDRCLENYLIPIEINDYCHYFDDFDDYIDLTDTIREDILLAFPTRTLCKEECEGFCPTCGTNLNISECECEEVDFEEDEEESSNVWAAFDNLNLDDLPSE